MYSLYNSLNADKLSYAITNAMTKMVTRMAVARYRSNCNTTATNKGLVTFFLYGILTAGLNLVITTSANAQNTSSTVITNTQAGINKPTPSTESSLYALLQAEFEIDRGAITKGLTTYKQQAMLNETASVFERALTLSLIHESTADSLAFVSKWRQQYPQHIPAWFYEANLALKAHDYAHASDALSRILRYDPQADLSQILVGILPDNETEQRLLLHTLQQLDSQQNTSLSALQAGLLLKFNELEQALQQTNHALNITPNYVPFIILKADILKKLGNPNEVLEYLDQSRKQTPNSQKLYLYQIRYLLELDKNKPALDLLIKAEKKFSDNKQITLLAALVSLDLNKFRVAEKFLHKLLDEADYQDEANYYLGISANRQQNSLKAISYFKKVTQDNLILDAQQHIVTFYTNKQQYDTAINALKTFRNEYDIYAPESYIMQAQILTQQQLTTDAKALLKKVTAEYPNHPELWFAYAQILDNDSDYLLKNTLLKRLNTLEPNNATYQLALAELYLSKNATNQQGLTLAQTVANIKYDDTRFNSSQHIEALTLLAAAELKKGNPQQVIAYLQNDYDILPTLPAGLLLWQAYQTLNQTQKASTIQADLQQKFNYTINTN